MRDKRGGVTPYMKQGILYLMIVLCSCLLSLTAYAKHVQIVTFHYPPVMDSNKQHGGLMGEIVHAAFHEVNIETDLMYYPAKRMLLNFIGTEKYLACIGPVALIDRQSEDRKHQVIRVPPLVDILMVFAYYKPTHGKKPTTYEQLTELSGLRVGTIRGSNTIPLLQDAGIDVSETSIESQIKMLKANRIDFAAVGYLTGLGLITKLFPGHEDEFAFIKKPIMELPTSIYFNKRFPKSDEYAEQFRTGLNAIIKNGQYIQILKKYYGKGNIPSEYKPIFQTLGIQYSF
jgi:polar amino acid transport system substrate-binding protein